MAGLLDGLFSGGSSSGLLDFLRNNAMNQQMPSGLPSDQAQYAPMAMAQMPLAQNAQPSPNAQSSPLDTAQWPQGPIGAPSALPQNAQPTQGQLPQQSGPGFGDNIMAGLNNLNSGSNPITMLANVASGFATGQRYDKAGIAQQQQNQTAKFLVSKGLEPEMAKAVVSSPELLRAVLPQIMGTGGQTDDIKEYQFAKRENPALTFEKFMQQKRSTSGAYGMQGYWGTKNGKPALLQLGKDGVPVEVKIPEGFDLARDPVKVEGPTGTTLLDPQTRQPVGFVPKDVAGAAKSKELGEAEGQALVNLPTTIATAETTLKTIKQLEDHPGKKSWGAFGMGAMLPDIPGSTTRGFAALVDQVKGQNFMTAFQSLKGAGAITEQEGMKAEKAQARLDRAQSEADFDAALKDLKEVISAGMERARQKAGIKNNQAMPAATGGRTVDDLLKKYGN